MCLADFDKLGHNRVTAQCVIATRFRKFAFFPEFTTVEIHDRIAGKHQHQRVRNIGQLPRLINIVVLDKLHAGRAVVIPVLGDIKPRVLDIEPRATLSIVLKIVFDCEVPFKIERVAVSTNRTRIERVDRFFDVRQQYSRICIISF